MSIFEVGPVLALPTHLSMWFPPTSLNSGHMCIERFSYASFIHYQCMCNLICYWHFRNLLLLFVHEIFSWCPHRSVHWWHVAFFSGCQLNDLRFEQLKDSPKCAFVYIYIYTCLVHVVCYSSLQTTVSWKAVLHHILCRLLSKLGMLEMCQWERCVVICKWQWAY